MATFTWFGSLGRRAALRTATAIALSAGLAACGGASDEVSSGSNSGEKEGATKLSLVAYAVPKPGYDKVIPAFEKTDAGKGITFTQSYGPSGDQSRKVEAGLSTDIVNFSVEPDVTRLVKAGLVGEDWNSDEFKGIPFGSVVTITVREGNPKGIKDWDDLLKPGIEVVTPEPVQLGLGQVEPAGPVRRQEQRRPGSEGRHRLHRQARRGSREGAAQVRARGHGDVPAGHR